MKITKIFSSIHWVWDIKWTEFKVKLNNIGSYGINKISLSSYKDKRICT